MRIVVLTKQVPDLVEELVVDDEGTALDPDEVEYKLNEFCEHALEEAICLKEAGGAEVTVVALDGEGVDKVLYTAIAKGADRAVKLVGPEPEDVGGTYALAKIFAGALANIPHDLVLTGVQGCDDRDGQLGPLVAAMLGLPCVSVATGLVGGSGTVSANKEYAGGMLARFEVSLPAVLGVQAARQTPRYAPVSKVRQIQKTTSLDEVDVGDAPDALSEVVSMAPPESGEGAVMLADVDALLKLLKEKGVA